MCQPNVVCLLDTEGARFQSVGCICPEVRLRPEFNVATVILTLTVKIHGQRSSLISISSVVLDFIMAVEPGEV